MEAAEATIGGKYRLVRLIASGGMGSVHEAVHLHTRGRVAIKILSDEAKRDEASHARFAREARASGQLRSRHVARVLDADVLGDGTPYLVMEYLDGRDVSQLVKERGKLPLPEAASILVQVCAGVAEAHANGIIHRDLKPGNIFLAEEGAAVVAKVLDFGISKVASEGDHEALTRTFSTVGTPGYMSPEQIRTPKDVDPATDVWSIGVLLYRLLTATLPFSGNASSIAVAICHEEPAPISLELPADVRALIAAMLRKDRDARPTLRDVAEVLVSYVDTSIARDACAELEALNLPRTTRALPREEHRAPAVEVEPTLAATHFAVGESARRRGDEPQRRARWPLAVIGVALLSGGAYFAMRTRSSPPAPPPVVAVAPPEPIVVPPPPAVSSSPSASPPPAQSAAVKLPPRPKAKPSSNAPAAASIPARL